MKIVERVRERVTDEMRLNELICKYNINVSKTSIFRFRRQGFLNVVYYKESESNLATETRWDLIYKKILKYVKMFNRYDRDLDYDIANNVCVRLLEQNKKLPQNEEELDKYLCVMTKIFCKREHLRTIGKLNHLEFNESILYGDIND